MKFRDISRKFLHSRKSHSLVNLVAIVSVVAILVPTAAMVIVLSVQNGLTDMIHSRFSKFDSELRVRPSSGQFFSVDSAEIVQIEEFAEVSSTLRSSAVVEWDSQSMVVELFGVDSNYCAVSDLYTTVEQGEWRLNRAGEPRAVVGSAISYNLGLSISQKNKLKITAITPIPKLPFVNVRIPVFASAELPAVGTYTLDESIDSRYIFVPIEVVGKLLGKPNEISTLELRPNIDMSEARDRVEAILGSDVTVESRYEQRQSLYSVIEAEKFVIYLVLIFVALIAAMSLSGCSLMMITEKRVDAVVLRSIGLSQSKVRRVFVELGMRIVVIGVVLGIILGSGVVLLQQYSELLRIGGAMGDEPYPVILSMWDVSLISLLMVAIGYGIVFVTVSSVKFQANLK